MAVQEGAGPIDRRLLRFWPGSWLAFSPDPVGLTCFLASFTLPHGVACGGVGLYTAPWFQAGLGWLAMEPYITGHGDEAA